MRIHSQNLSRDSGLKETASIFWHGRAWLKKAIGYDDIARLEWAFGKHADSLSAYITFGSGENNRGIMFHIGIPFLLSIYLTFETRLIKACERRLGFAVHNQSFWLYVFDEALGDGGSAKKCWYKRYYCWNFPWQYDWYSTEVLTTHTPELAESVYIEKSGDRKRLGIDSFEMMRRKEFYEKMESAAHDYVYRLKSGVEQHRKATIYVSRMTWRMRWWPLLPFKKASTSIDVKFNDEVGERAGSWKGGCIGCGYEMRSGETPVECLWRMERDRKFER